MPKRLKNLYAGMCDPIEVRDAIKAAAKNKKRRNEVNKVLANIDEEVDNIMKLLADESWYPPKHTPRAINDGTSKKKTRYITIPDFKYEQIMHHLVIRRIQPRIMRVLDQHVCGSVPGRGTHKVLHYIHRWIQEYHGKKFYVAEADIRKFFDTIDHTLFMTIFEHHIKDKRYIELVKRIVDNYSSELGGEGVGFPLGNYTSPWFAYIYLLEMDNYILQVLKPDHYTRYMDNIYFMCRNKKKLKQMVRDLDNWLREKRKLQLKPDWQVYRFDEGKPKKKGQKRKGRPIDCLGFKVWRNRITVKKSILKHLKKVAKRMYKDKNKRSTRHIFVEDCHTYASLFGYLAVSDSVGYYNKHIRHRMRIEPVLKKLSNAALGKVPVSHYRGGYQSLQRTLCNKHPAKYVSVKELEKDPTLLDRLTKQWEIEREQKKEERNNKKGRNNQKKKKWEKQKHGMENYSKRPLTRNASRYFRFGKKRRIKDKDEKKIESGVENVVEQLQAANSPTEVGLPSSCDGSLLQAIFKKTDQGGSSNDGLEDCPW